MLKLKEGFPEGKRAIEGFFTARRYQKAAA